MRKRLLLALDMLTAPPYRKTERILDVGYGGGTFIPSLAQIAKSVYGIDLHQKMAIVKKILARERIYAHLTCDSIFKTKFKSKFFNKIVCLSVLEHFKGKELDKACREFKRLLTDDGYVVVGFPTKNCISNFIIEHILKFKPDEIHPSGHQDILCVIAHNFSKYEIVSYPQHLPLDLVLYVVVKAWR